MTSKITEGFARAVSGATLFVLIAGFNTAWSTEADASANASVRTSAEANESEPTPADDEPLVAATEEFADKAVTAATDFGDAVSESIEESVKDDVRASVQEDLVTELRGSLTLPGQD